MVELRLQNVAHLDGLALAPWPRPPSRGLPAAPPPKEVGGDTHIVVPWSQLDPSLIPACRRFSKTVRQGLGYPDSAASSKDCSPILPEPGPFSPACRPSLPNQRSFAGARELVLGPRSLV